MLMTRVSFCEACSPVLLRLRTHRMHFVHLRSTLTTPRTPRDSRVRHSS
jgi:hypothetical protein